jgi:protein O-mannosyl-transferase
MTGRMRRTLQRAIYFGGTAAAFDPHARSSMNQRRFSSEITTANSVCRDVSRVSAENRSRKFSYRPFMILFFLIFLVYSNTFHASWHFDDYPNIVNNPKIQITEFSTQSLVRSMQHPSGAAYWRPLAYLTFALNWFAGGKEVFGYHFVNILLHSLSACLLFLTILTLFQTPTLRGKHSESVQSAALLATALWAINPIQTQSVTLIVQRMTLLAAFFYIGGIFCYLKARLSGSQWQRSMLFSMCLTSWLLGMASKETALLLPLTLVLMEVIFFRDLGDTRTKKQFLTTLAGTSIIVAIIGGLLFLKGNPWSIFEGYGDRYFTPVERLMTQPRVLFFYLTLIFCPFPGRLSIDHDVALSTSLMHPWTTLPAIVFVVVVIVAALLQIRKRPLLSFAILFFFLNHLVESSIVPLEMVFEHRNYLPSMFLFVPVAGGIVRLLNRYHEIRPTAYRIMIALGICLFIGLGWMTYARNSVWQTEVSLWTDANRKAPGLYRPVHNLAMARYESSGRLDQALELYQKAARLKMHRRSNLAGVYANIAGIYYRKLDYKNAAMYFGKAYDIAPFDTDHRFRLAETLNRLQQWQPALVHIDALLARHPRHPDYLDLKGTILMQRGNVREALRYFHDAIRVNPKRLPGIINAGAALMAIQAYANAEKLFKYAIELDHRNLMTYLRLIDVNLRNGDTREAEVLLRYLVSAATVDDINASLIELSEEPLFDKKGYKELTQSVATALKKTILFVPTEDIQSR